MPGETAPYLLFRQSRRSSASTVPLKYPFSTLHTNPISRYYQSTNPVSGHSKISTPPLPRQRTRPESQRSVFCKYIIYHNSCNFTDTDTEHNYDTHEERLLAIFNCFKIWRHYLEGSQHRIDVVTDHKNLEYFSTTKMLTRHQLSAFNLRLSHPNPRPSGTNGELR